jgi:hypothetical protein
MKNRIKMVWTKVQDDRLVDCRENDLMSWRLISKRFGMSENTCKRRYDDIKQEKRESKKEQP